MQGLPARPDFSPPFSEPGRRHIPQIFPAYFPSLIASNRPSISNILPSGGRGNRLLLLISAAPMSNSIMCAFAFGIILIWMLRHRPGGLLPESRLTTGAHDVLRRALEK